MQLQSEYSRAWCGFLREFLELVRADRLLSFLDNAATPGNFVNSGSDPFSGISSHGTAAINSAHLTPYGFEDISLGFNGACPDFLYTQLALFDQLPLLPLPPPESLPPPSPAVEKPSESNQSAPKSRCLRSEVVQHLFSPHYRAPSSRKRNADEETSNERPLKKGKQSANKVLSSTPVFVH
ncbi:hypothetical protein K438DRAFT_1763882 [Mycena galopus ATCC 62051]|nr:hypothetical protein K438DRAFT_1763882 [Mycena galopus ATCC 62051]